MMCERCEQNASKSENSNVRVELLNEQLPKVSNCPATPLQNYFIPISAKRLKKRNIAKKNFKQFQKGTGEKRETVG